MIKLRSALLPGNSVPSLRRDLTYVAGAAAAILLLLAACSNDARKSVEGPRHAPGLNPGQTASIDTPKKNREATPYDTAPISRGNWFERNLGGSWFSSGSSNSKAAETQPRRRPQENRELLAENQDPALDAPVATEDGKSVPVKPKAKTAKKAPAASGDKIERMAQAAPVGTVETSGDVMPEGAIMEGDYPSLDSIPPTPEEAVAAQQNRASTQKQFEELMRRQELTDTSRTGLISDAKKETEAFKREGIIKPQLTPQTAKPATPIVADDSVSAMTDAAPPMPPRMAAVTPPPPPVNYARYEPEAPPMPPIAPPPPAPFAGPASKPMPLPQMQPAPMPPGPAADLAMTPPPPPMPMPQAELSAAPKPVDKPVEKQQLKAVSKARPKENRTAAKEPTSSRAEPIRLMPPSGVAAPRAIPSALPDSRYAARRGALKHNASPGAPGGY